MSPATAVPGSSRAAPGPRADEPSLEACLRALEDAAASAPYTMLPRRIGAGSPGLHRQVLSRLVERLPQRFAASALPRSLAECVHRHMERMQRRIAASDDAYFDVGNDRFAKDLAIGLLRLYPVGAELVDPRAGLPRTLLARGGLAQALRGVRLWASCGFSLRPFCELHMHPDALEEFSEDGWTRTYLRVADVLEADPSLKGLFGTAWFYDPAVATISPHLAYLRELRIEHGAQGFDFGPTAAAREDALLRSATRRRLHREGRYTPRTYYLVWPRARLLAWAHRVRADGSGGGAGARA